MLEHLRRRRPGIGIFAHKSSDELVEFTRTRRREEGNVARSQRAPVRIARLRELDEHRELEHRDSEGEHVGLARDADAEHLLGHVRRIPFVLACVVVPLLDESKVAQQNTTFGDQEIGRLNVAVNEIEAVEALQSRACVSNYGPELRLLNAHAAARRRRSLRALANREAAARHHRRVVSAEGRRGLSKPEDDELRDGPADVDGEHDTLEYLSRVPPVHSCMSVYRMPSSCQALWS